MDVVLKPTESQGTTWSLKDRLGRTLGAVKQSTQVVGFEITPVAGGGLNSVPRLHATLDEAMTAIAKHMQGGCTLDSQEWD